MGVYGYPDFAWFGVLLCLLAVALRPHSCHEEEEVPPGLEPSSNTRSSSPPEGWGHHITPSCPSPPLIAGTKPTQGCRKQQKNTKTQVLLCGQGGSCFLLMDKEGQSLEV